MNFDENGNRIPKISKTDAHLVISETRAEIIADNYICRRCKRKLSIIEHEGEKAVKCRECQTVSSVFTRRVIA